MPDTKNTYITTVEAAKALQVSTQTIRRWIHNGFLPAFQAPSRLRNSPQRGARGVYRIRREDLEKFLKKGQRPYKIHEH